MTDDTENLLRALATFSIKSGPDTTARHHLGGRYR